MFYGKKIELVYVENPEKTMNPETPEIPEAAIVDIKFYIKKTTFIKKCLGFIVWQMDYNRPSDAGDTSLGL